MRDYVLVILSFILNNKILHRGRILDQPSKITVTEVTVMTKMLTDLS